MMLNDRDRMTDPDDTADMAGGRLMIDLAALRSNYRQIARHVAPARAAAVVKADAYGLGVRQAATALAESGCRDFFVAHLGEARALRPILPADARLYVLNGLMPGTEMLCAHAGILPVLNSVDQAARWREAAQSIGRPLPAVLQFDSGMARLGIDDGEARQLAGDTAFRAHVPLALVMSHLACADTLDSPVNAAQIARFDALAGLFPSVPRSFANSGGAFLAPAFHNQIVRPGIALYGGAPNDAQPNPMRPVIRLDARVIQVRTIAAGGGVGYGHSFHAPHETRIATIAVGYADGLPRSLSNRGAAWFNGTRLPIAGRVSMDSITLDVTALPEGALKLGDWVELIGPHQSLDRLAQDAGTISYEILTSLGARYHRIYRDAADAQA
ncbi:alanine racemase [Sphingomonas sp. KC8]|uniref:alanine racemase n=1 Tax=Sphingomonas sp. KC8 TaxID=1030157 RepID=UPI000248A45C|nr:alanine racemase [Sphingomonas sp. KC8]ARS27047.1 alanine racemase [Sphingomonas sp. KC8]